MGEEEQTWNEGPDVGKRKARWDGNGKERRWRRKKGVEQNNKPESSILKT